MRTITSRTYTNVALTVLVALLLVLVVGPYVSAPSAQAQFNDSTFQKNVQQSARAASLNSAADNAKATREVAQATKEVAKAIRESAKAQRDIAKALHKLSVENK